MPKRLFLLQALAILIAVLQDEHEERSHNRILSNVFYPYLTARYVKNQMTCTRWCALPPSSQPHGACL